jgi:hypothetical protein
MKILAVAKVDPQTTREKIQPHLAAETMHAWKLYKEGTIREMYDRRDRMGVVFVLECDSVADARTSLSELPFVREKLIDFEVIPLGPFSYFEMLFTDHQPPQQGRQQHCVADSLDRDHDKEGGSETRGRASSARLATTSRRRSRRPSVLKGRAETRDMGPCLRGTTAMMATGAIALSLGCGDIEVDLGRHRSQYVRMVDRGRY